MRIGFTGTQAGMSSEQANKLDSFLRGLQVRGHIENAHHGDCVGADAQFHALARSLGFTIITHPCDITSKRAYMEADLTFAAKPPLVRNHNIVDLVDLLIATPRHDYEELRSGTWATIRYARKIGVKHHIIYPGNAQLEAD